MVALILCRDKGLPFKSLGSSPVSLRSPGDNLEDDFSLPDLDSAGTTSGLQTGQSVKDLKVE